MERTAALKPSDRLGSGDAARYLKLAPATFRNYVKSGRIRPAGHLGTIGFGSGGRHVFTVAELNRFQKTRQPRGGGYDPEVWKDWTRLRKRILSGRLTHRQAAEAMGVPESSVSRRLAKERRQEAEAIEAATA